VEDVGSFWVGLPRRESGLRGDDDPKACVGETLHSGPKRVEAVRCEVAGRLVVNAAAVSRGTKRGRGAVRWRRGRWRIMPKHTNKAHEVGSRKELPQERNVVEAQIIEKDVHPVQ